MPQRFCMTNFQSQARFLVHPPTPHVQHTPTRAVSILACPGKPSMNLKKLNQILDGVAVLDPMIAIQSPQY